MEALCNVVKQERIMSWWLIYRGYLIDYFLCTYFCFIFVLIDFYMGPMLNKWMTWIGRLGNIVLIGFAKRNVLPMWLYYKSCLHRLRNSATSSTCKKKYFEKTNLVFSTISFIIIFSCKGCLYKVNGKEEEI